MNVFKAVSDSEILKLLCESPSEGIRVLVEQYSSFVFTIAYSKLRNVYSTDDIEEFVGYIFSEIYMHRNIIDLKRGSLKGFISGLSKKLCIDEYRKIQSNITESDALEDFADTLHSDENIQLNAEQRLEHEHLAKAIKMLGHSDRMLLIKHYYFNQTSAQIAEEMNITDAAVRKRISRAVDKLRKIMVQNNKGGTVYEEKY